MAGPERRISTATGKPYYRQRWIDDDGKERSKNFKRRIDAVQFARQISHDQVAGVLADPETAKITVGEWCDRWLAGYGGRPATVREARTHVVRIKAGLGGKRLRALKPSDVRAWVAGLQDDGLEQSYIYALHARLSQICADAVHDGILQRNPCSRRTSPKAGGQRPYVATTAQVWALHDAMPEYLRIVVVLGAFAGLRVSEIAGLRDADVDWDAGVIRPAVQWGDEPLKTDSSKMPIPMSDRLAKMMADHRDAYPGDHVVCDPIGDPVGPWKLQRAWREARAAVIAQDVEAGRTPLPGEMRLHDLRHYLASLLIHAGCDVKTVQARLRHESATTTLRVYAHLWPDADESARAAIDNVLAARADDLD